MKTMIDKMADAMANAVIGSDEGDFPRLFDMLDFSGENNAWLVTRGLARAALEALLKPTTAMDQAALAELSDATVEDPKAAAWDAVRGYRAMIQAALDEAHPASNARQDEGTVV